RAVPRLVLLAPALIGCVMLVPAAALGMITLLSGSTSDSAALGGLAPWVLWFVYGCFTWWGAGLATTTALYWTDSRPRCARCGLRGAAPTSATSPAAARLDACCGVSSGLRPPAAVGPGTLWAERC